MTHGFRKQHLEVLPLDGRGVLKLVDHHMLELGTNLLENKRRVAAINERVEQLLGVAQQETVICLVNLAYLFLNAA